MSWVDDVRKLREEWRRLELAIVFAEVELRGLFENALFRRVRRPGR